MMVLGQYRAVLAGIWWYWVSMGQHWLVLGDTGVSITWYSLVLSGTGLIKGFYASIY